MDAIECFHEMANERVQETDVGQAEWITGELSHIIPGMPA